MEPVKTMRVFIAAIAAPFAAGPLADRIGRKWDLIISSVFFIVAYALMLAANEVWMLLLARVIQGCGVGFVFTVQPMYVGEIATDAVRGATGSLMVLFINSGILYVYLIGPYVSYNALQWCCLAVPIIFVALFSFMPESPYYFAEKGQKLDALNSLQFLRGQTADVVEAELTTIQGEVEEAMTSKGSFLDIIEIPGNRKALIISTGLIAFQQLSGITAVLFNSQSIFESAGGGLDPAIATIIVGCVQVGSSGLTPIIADRIGRKVILLISAFGMSIGTAALGAFFYTQKVASDASNIIWLPVPALVLFIILYGIGFGPLPWVVVGELFPPNVKSIASSIAAFTCSIVAFVVTLWYPALDALGSQYAFWLFAICSVFAFFFTIFVAMETKGLSLHEIQDKLKEKNHLK
ncbi:facilitated trehalose transporter Tret1-like isoform X2 [Eurosta solidaginis]|uniref:facilitated trehalose transporter Tret1-like isoform X2 n=1 Tax=Eurosta solidaginis TaxID=178769 RepID=UPI003530FE51